MTTRRWPHQSLVMMIVFATAAVFIAVSAAAPAQAQHKAIQSPAIPTTSRAWDDDYVWTRWSAEQNALLQEGDYLWIGTSNGVLRWHIPTQTETRYSTIDGMPSHRIFAVAIDLAGNRWFGGDGGLSRLDAANLWTHFTTANSALHSNIVDGIAVGADGTLWLSHEMPNGSVSRLAPDGNWTWFPNRAAVVASDYAAVLQTQNINPLWVVTDGDVWVDFSVYDGRDWRDRTPPAVEGAHPDLMTAWHNQVWALFVEGRIHHWTGAHWETLTPEPVVMPNGGFALSTMVVTEEGRLWVAGRGRYCIHGCAAAIILFPADRTEPDLLIDEVTIVSALAASVDGIWAIGPAWLYSPDGTLHQIADTPIGDTFTSVIAGDDGMLWLSSISRRFMDVNAPAALQGIDDATTTVLHDDNWQIAREGFTASVAERTPASDLWLTLVQYSIYNYLCPQQVIVRHHQDQWIEYTPPISGPTSSHCPAITDIFAQDEHNTWFAYVGPQQQNGDAESGVLHLNDGGTPTVLADDVWTNYPFPALHTRAQIAVNDEIWLATSDALYRWQEGNWQSTNDPTDRHLCDLTVAEGGYLLAQRDYLGQCGQPSLQISLLHATSEGIERTLFNSVEHFLNERWEIARGVTRRNPLFAHDASGATWYFALDDLCRRTSDQAAAQCAVLPEPFTTLSQIEVDSRGHLWFAGDGALWRWSPRPSFTVQANPGWLWMTPNSIRYSILDIQSVEGFDGTAEVSTGALPDGVTAELASTTVSAGASVTLTITTAADVAMGEHRLTIQAVGAGAVGAITKTVPITVWVATEVYEQYLPLIVRVDQSRAMQSQDSSHP